MFFMPSIHCLVKTLANFVRFHKQVKTCGIVSGLHWSALTFSQMFTSGFTRLWRYVLLDKFLNK